MTIRLVLSSLVVAALAASTTAFADEPEAAAATPPPAASAPPVLSAFENSTPLSTDELGEQRAKAKIEVDKLTINAPEQNGVVANNTAINTKTGNNAISGDSFSNAAGFVSTIQNTGNNVLIQNSTIVNVSVAP